MSEKLITDGGEVTIADARELLASPDHREMLREVPDELQDDIQAFLAREMDPAEFVGRLRDQAEFLERSAAALEADEEIDTDTDDRKPIRDDRSPEMRDIDDLVMKLREVEGVRSVDSASETTVGLTFNVSRWQDGANIPEAAATLLVKSGFVPSSFGREHDSEHDEYLPTIRFEAGESVAARGDKSQ